jgi:hypothetical protein
VIIFDPGGGEPTQWAVCFALKASTVWLTRLPVGRFKHVRAFGCVPHINTWLFFDPALDRTSIKVARGDAATALIAEYLHDATVIQMPARDRHSKKPAVFGWCAPSVAHLIGLSSGALRCDTLFRDCLRAGGVLLADGHPDIHPAAD